MKTFPNQIELTAYFEAFSPTAYKDIAGVWTIGYGQARTLPAGTPITEGMTCTEEQARSWLEHMFLLLKDTLRREKYPKIWSVQNFFEDAMVDYAYNCGISAFPNLIEKLKDDDYPGASLEFLDGFYVHSKPIKGLLLRRISNYNTFMQGTYLAWQEGDAIPQDLKNKLLFMNPTHSDAVSMINNLKVKSID